MFSATAFLRQFRKIKKRFSLSQMKALYNITDIFLLMQVRPVRRLQERPLGRPLPRRRRPPLPRLSLFSGQDCGGVGGGSTLNTVQREIDGASGADASCQAHSGAGGAAAGVPACGRSELPGG